ncbi:MAG: hypothetical protein HY906_19865 [Deltaproteobacteria bacterium]|nr:hypothetical protein [Deltaproteobacteria bacterium]
MGVARWVVLLGAIVMAAPAAAQKPGAAKKPAAARPKSDPTKTMPAAAEAVATLREAQGLLEAVAAAKPASAAQRRRLRSLLRDPSGDVATVAAWALARLKEKAALAEMAHRLERRKKLPEFAGSAEEAFLRLAPLRMRKLTPKQAQAEWARLLEKDPSPFVRAEAAREVVAAHHPQALPLLRQAVTWARSQDAAAQAVVLGQVAAVMRLVGKETVADLRGMLRDAGYPRFPYGYVLELEHCQTLMKAPCGELETYHAVGSYARRSLTFVTGESERDLEQLH